MSKDAYGHLCTVTGALWRPNGRWFDGSDDRINCGKPAALQNLSQKTVLLWMKGDIAATGYDTPFHHGYKTSDYGEYFSWDTAAATLTILLKNTAGTGVNGAIACSKGVWYLLGYSWDGTTVSYYSNGNEATTADALTGTMGCSSTDLELGRYPNVEYYKGLIGEVFIYNRGLSPLEIQHNYLATKWRYR